MKLQLPEINTKTIIYGGIFIAILMNGTNIANMATDSDGTRAARDDFRTFNREERKNAARNGELSDLALERVKNGCIPVVDEDTRQPTYIYEGRGHVALNGEQVRGAYICSATGDTAYVGQNGAEAIARVAAEDKAEYDDIYNSLR